MDRLSLPVSFFERPVETVANDLIGCRLVSEVGPRVSGRIVETEAYGMEEEAFFGRHIHLDESGAFRTSKAGEVLLGPPGVAFIYQVFFGNWLLNVTAGPPGYLGCVLLRSVEPDDGLEIMRWRRDTLDPDIRLASGPGRLTKAFAIDGSLNGQAMQSTPLILCSRDSRRSPEVARGPRIGVKRQRELRWRFIDVDSRSLSRPPGVIADRQGNP